MRALLITCGLLLAGWRAGLSAENASAPRLLKVTVLVEFQDAYAKSVWEMMRDEVVEAFEEKIPLEIRLYRSGDATPPMERAIVSRVSGECRATDEEPARMGHDLWLGYTHITDGHLLPFIEIDCGRVWTVARQARIRLGTRPECVLGRALARVTAHEIYHVLADTRAHASKGIAQAKLTSMELATHCFRFDPPSISRMVNGLLPGRREVQSASREYSPSGHRPPSEPGQ